MPQSPVLPAQTREVAPAGIVDQHVHPEKGPYAPGTYPLSWFQSYLDAGGPRGVTAIGLVEHAYRFTEARGLLDGPWADGRCRYRLEDYDLHRRDLTEAGLPVRFGLEVDHVPGKTDALRAFLDQREWDLLLGSVHWLGDFPIDLDPAYWHGHEPDAIWEAYTTAVEDLCASGLYDVLTHPDLPKLFGHQPRRDPQDWYRRIAQALTAANMAIEINTNGMNRPVTALYPEDAFLREAYSRGVPISLGSDAHEPTRVGEHFDQAVALARGVGYDRFVTFQARSRDTLPLPALPDPDAASPAS